MAIRGFHSVALRLRDAAKAVMTEIGVDVEYPRQLIRPFGVQLENIRPGVQHIDLVYFAETDDEGARIPDDLRKRDRVGWYDASELAALGVNDEIQQWVAKVVPRADVGSGG